MNSSYIENDQRSNWHDLFVAANILIFSHLWSFTLIPVQVYKGLEILAIGIMFVICFLNRSLLNIRQMPFGKYVWLLMLLPWLSAIPAYIVHEQPFLLSGYMLRYELVWVFYFVLHIFNPSPERILRIIIWFGLIWAFLLIIQQFSYPHYWFATRVDDLIAGKTIELRNGIYRFMTTGYSIAVIALLYAFQRALLSEQSRRLLWFVVFAVCLMGVYFLMTRQLLVAVVISIIASMFCGEKLDIKFLTFGFVFIAGLVVFELRDSIFGEMIIATEDQIIDNIRYHAMQFFLFDYWKSPICLLFGNGVEHDSTAYGAEMLFFQESYKYYRADIGIVGKLSQYGIIYLLVFVAFSVNIFTMVFRKIDLYQKLFFLSAYIPIMMIFPLTNSFFIIAFILVLYLSEYSLSTNI